MNKITLEHGKINGGKKTTFYSNMSEEQTKTLVSEVLVEQPYKKGRIKRNMTIIDCGANIGLASYFFKDWAKQIYAIEPSPLHYECLVANMKPLKNVKCFNFAITSRNGNDALATNDGGKIPESFFGNGNERQVVPTKTMKAFMEEAGIDHVDLLKLDTEGAEYVIFPSNGFKSVADKIDNIIGESHYFGRLMPEFIPIVLKDSGYETKFLDMDNLEFHMNFDDGISKKKYSVFMQTMFFATRK